MATLYITEPGARLEKEYKRLRVVNKEGQSLLVTPLSRVSEVVLVGWAGATTPAMLTLLDAGVGLTFLTRNGKIRGRLAPPTGKNLALRRQQYRQADDVGFCLRLSQAIVAGKLRNSRTMARRMIRSGVEPPPGQLERLKAAIKAVDRMVVPGSRQIPTHVQPEGAQGKDGLEQAGQSNRKSEPCAERPTHCVGSRSIENLKSTLMGQEGHGAKAYFSILRRALNKRLQFEARSRRPPKDPVNALLSLGYSLLTANFITAAEIVGLDPYCGFFHGLAAYGRPALALDLMEEFRPIIVDSIVLTLVNKRMLSATDFEPARGTDRPGVYLTRRGLRIFFEQYTHRLDTPVYHPVAGRALSYQKILEVQTRQVAKLIKGEIEAYQPFLVK